MKPVVYEIHLPIFRIRTDTFEVLENPNENEYPFPTKICTVSSYKDLPTPKENQILYKLVEDSPFLGRGFLLDITEFRKKENIGKTVKTLETAFDENPIQLTCLSLNSLLQEKNRRYGNSALEPLGLFNKKGASESIKIRLDDKLMRVRNSTELRKNDIADILGYLVLLCVSEGWTNFDDLID